VLVGGRPTWGVTTVWWRRHTLLGSEGMSAPVGVPSTGEADGAWSLLVLGPFFENCIVVCEHLCGQVSKGARWMPRRQEPRKDVGGCDKPRGAANRAEIRGCPNGETRQQSCAVTHI
jgi:hypothetical protein